MADNSTRLPSPRRRLTLTPPPMATPIEDWGQAWQQIVHISNAVNRVAAVAEVLDAVVPEIQDDAHNAQIQSARAAVMAESLDGRLSRLESLVAAPHICVQDQAVKGLEVVTRGQAHEIAMMSADAAAARERISIADEDIESVQVKMSSSANRRRDVFYWIVGLVLAGFGAVGGAIWFVAQMATTLEMESIQRQRDISVLIDRLDQLQEGRSSSAQITVESLRSARRGALKNVEARRSSTSTTSSQDASLDGDGEGGGG